MSGLGLVLDVAKGALLAQKYAIEVTSHNISNVNTPGYTRQIPTLQAITGSPFGGVILGRGVSVDEVVRNSDAFIETRLRDRNSELTALIEKETYMSALEGIFNENSGGSLSTQLSDFWNAWEDLSNNPSGLAERSILYERGALVAQTFQDQYSDLNQILAELESSIQIGVEKINELLDTIADLNVQIVQLRVTGNANDLMDQRNQALTQLSEYMDIRSMEDEDGNLTVTTGKGYLLVSRKDFSTVRYDGGKIIWEGSGTSEVTITNEITAGKLGGWLDLRDKTIPEYKASLDELAGAVILETNKIYSQGVGLEGFSSFTGSYAASDSGAALGTAASGLDFYNAVADGTLNLWLYDASGAVVGGGATSLTIDADVTSLNDLVTDISAIDANLTASVSGGKLSITASSGYSFAFSDDTSNVLAALGVNTFFTGFKADEIAVQSDLESHLEWIAAGRVGSTGAVAAGDNTNALAVAGLQDEAVTIKRWTYERGGTATSSNEVGTIEGYLHAFVGSVGIDSQSIQRTRAFNEVIVNTLSETRDNISAVSIDEEMVSLIKYQHAYAAAAKLITAADEMLRTLLEVK